MHMRSVLALGDRQSPDNGNVHGWLCIQLQCVINKIEL